jgi:hypothetical protein
VTIRGELGKLVHFNVTVTSPDGRAFTYMDEVEEIVPSLMVSYGALDPATWPTCSVWDVYYVS